MSTASQQPLPMIPPRTKRRALRGALAALCASLALSAPSATRAADCFAQLTANPRWSCSAELSSGTSVTYCLNLAQASGSGAFRSFDMVTTGPFPRTCTCGAKGKGVNAAYNTASTYQCFDEGSSTAEFGRVTAKRIVGQTLNVSADVRTTFVCQPDPSCVVPMP